MLRNLLYIILFLNSGTLIAQTDTLNQTDNQGKKQGYWIIYGKMKPEKGYCDTCIIEEGPYKDSRRHGLWKKYNTNPYHLKLELHYVNNRPIGKYQKYYPPGNLEESGNFTGRKYVDSLIRYHPCGNIAQIQFFRKDGKEEGKGIYYFNNCNCPDSTSAMPEFIYTKKDGYQVDTAWRFYPSGCIKEIVIYDSSGVYIESFKFENTCINPPFQVNNQCFGLNPDPDPPIIPPIYPPPDTIIKNGYNKIYNKNNELWMDGEFKAGKLYNGKLYKYDSDGILMKIEIWKNGKYHSDGRFN